MLKIAIIGAGFMGKTHAECYQNMANVELVAICDVNEKQVKSLASEYSCQYVLDYNDILCNKEIDIVDICLPTFLHEEYVVKAAQSGKHVFCEKPITLTQSAFDNMINAVEKANVKLAVGQVLRFWPEYAYAKEQYDNQSFGKIKLVYASRRATHPNWSDWFKKRENSGGGLFDLHLHDLDYLCYVFGTVKQVYAIGAKNEAGCWNHINTSLTFENGISVMAEGIMDMPSTYPFSTTLRFIGEKAALECTMVAGNNLEDVGSSIRKSVWYESDKNTTLDIDLYDAYLLELQYFVDCIENDKELDKISIKSVKHVFSVLLAIEKSLETGAVVHL